MCQIPLARTVYERTMLLVRPDMHVVWRGNGAACRYRFTRSLCNRALTMASTTRGKILIAGAGIGGLVAASCLLMQGWDVEIYEQAPELKEIGAGIQLSANAMHVLRHLGLEERILDVGVRPGAYVFRLHDTGEIIQTFALSDAHEATHGAPYVQLHRADLLDLLLAKARA